MYRIAWKSKTTGSAGHGEWLDFDPKDMVSGLNKEWQNLIHWVEQR